jgi:ribosome-associated toxin RatA of RatAB toxin-antitoxin module
MAELRGSATDLVAAPLAECFAFVQAVDRYPSWHPDVVREVEVLERDAEGRPHRVRTKLHVARGPLVKDFDLILAMIAEPPEGLKLTRVSDHPSDQSFDVAWRLREGARTRMTIDLSANLNVPRFLPLGGIGDSMAEGFVQAAKDALAEAH